MRHWGPPSRYPFMTWADGLFALSRHMSEFFVACTQGLVEDCAICDSAVTNGHGHIHVLAIMLPLIESWEQIASSLGVCIGHQVRAPVTHRVHDV